MSTETNKRVVRTMMESHDKGDFAAMRAALDPGLVAHVGGHDLDADAFEGMARAFSEAFTSSRHIVEHQVAEGDWVTTRLTWTGVHTGAFQGIPASNRPVSIAAVSCSRVLEGRIVEHRPLIDVMALMTQIGAIPAAA